MRVKITGAHKFGKVDNQAMDASQAPSFTWTIRNFSSAKSNKRYSDVFVAADYEWRIRISTEGTDQDSLIVHLEVADSAIKPNGWWRYVKFALAVVNQVHSKYTIKKDVSCYFYKNESDTGFASFMPLGELNDPSKGYLINDTCVIEVVVLKVIDSRRRQTTSPASQRRNQAVPQNQPKKELGNTSGSQITDPKVYHDSTPKTVVKKNSLVSYAPPQVLEKSPPTRPSPLKDQEVTELSTQVQPDDDFRDLFTDMEDLVDPAVVKHSVSSADKPAPLDQLSEAREKLKALLALDLDEAAEHTGEIVDLASILASSSVKMKKLLLGLVSTMVLENFLSTKAEAADFEQKLSKRRKLAEAFVEKPKELESLRTAKQQADDNVVAHERTIKECEAEIERLQKKIAHHKEQLVDSQRMAEMQKETFKTERDKVACMKNELATTKDAVISWKESHAAALVKERQLKREWATLTTKIITSLDRV